MGTLHCNNEALGEAGSLHLSCVTGATAIAGFGLQGDLDKYMVVEHSGHAYSSSIGEEVS